MLEPEKAEPTDMGLSPAVEEFPSGKSESGCKLIEIYRDLEFSAVPRYLLYLTLIIILSVIDKCHGT